MRFAVLTFALLLPATSCIAAPPAPAPSTRPANHTTTTPSAASEKPAPPVSRAGADLPADAGADAVLDALDERGRTLNEFSADVKLTDTDESTALSSSRSGKMWFQNKADGRIRVVFDTKDDGKHIYDEKLEYLLTPPWLVDRDYKKRIEVRRQVVKPGQKINLLKLGEGPFPLPIGQKKEDVHQQFDVEKVAPGKSDPSNTVHVTLKPKKGTQFSRRFSIIDVWVDRDTRMPSRIDTLDANQTTTHSTDLAKLAVNPSPALTEADFTLPPIDEKNWDLHNEPYKE